MHGAKTYDQKICSIAYIFALIFLYAYILGETYS
jgi:hypothetical protein